MNYFRSVHDKAFLGGPWGPHGILGSPLGVPGLSSGGPQGVSGRPGESLGGLEVPWEVAVDPPGVLFGHRGPVRGFHRDVFFQLQNVQKRNKS